MQCSPHLSLPLLLLLLHPTLEYVIAPPWADPATNPCSLTSWQMVFWPPSGQCHQIFSQGPCPPTQELGFNPVLLAPECQCPQALPLLWSPTQTCYSRYSRGPCEVNQYLDLDPADRPTCRTSERCEPGEIFWPPDQACHQLYTQGPCHKGDLLIVNPESTEPYCGCDPVLLNHYFYPPLKLCYEQLTRGPCEDGLLLMYNHSLDTTQCACSPHLPNFFPALGQCFELEAKGPCGNGQVFAYNAELKQSECRCKEKYVYWEETDSCYREYTPGPCHGYQFIIQGPQGAGVCTKNPCSKTDLFFPDAEDTSQGECHKVGNRGPCPRGELVIFEAYAGKSYRGSCGCSPGYNQNYWALDQRCYEWYSQGPCNQSFVFKYNRETRSTECICDPSGGFVYWNETEACYRPYTQGPCPDNSWLIPSGGEKEEIYCECREGFQFSADEYTCQPKPVIKVSGHRFENLWSKVAEYMEKTKKENTPKNKPDKTRKKVSPTLN